MKLSRRRCGTVDILLPAGALAEDHIASFEAAMREEIESDNPHLVVSLEDVPYVDSQGLETLRALAGALRSRSRMLKLAAPSATCREILDLTGLTGEFEIFDEVDDAVRSFL